MRRNRLDIFIHQPVNNARSSRRVRDADKPAREMSLAEINEELSTHKSNGFKAGGKEGRYEALMQAKAEKERRGDDSIRDVTGRHHPETGGVKTPINDEVRGILDAAPFFGQRSDPNKNVTVNVGGETVRISKGAFGWTVLEGPHRTVGSYPEKEQLIEAIKKNQKSS